MVDSATNQFDKVAFQLATIYHYCWIISEELNQTDEFEKSITDGSNNDRNKESEDGENENSNHTSEQVKILRQILILFRVL